MIDLRADHLVAAYKALCCRFAGNHSRTHDAAEALEIVAKRAGDLETAAFWSVIKMRATGRSKDTAYKPCAGCPGARR